MALQAKTIPIPKPLKKYDSARGIKQTFVSWTNVRVARRVQLIAATHTANFSAGV
jgi:hypothetical protein